MTRWRARLGVIWWSIIAMVPVWTVVSVGLAWQGLIRPDGTGPFTSVWVLVVVGLLFAHPVAMYFDTKRVRRAGLGWEPEPAVFTGAATLGIIVPVVAPFVALGYLYLRWSRTRYR